MKINHNSSFVISERGSDVTGTALLNGVAFTGSGTDNSLTINGGIAHCSNMGVGNTVGKGVVINAGLVNINSLMLSAVPAALVVENVGGTVSLGINNVPTILKSGAITPFVIG
jgi:hypothetical protein